VRRIQCTLTPKNDVDPLAALLGTFSVLLRWFRQRAQGEVTFAEVRAHLGVETQRQWSDLATVRLTLWASRLFPGSVETRTDEKVPPEVLEIWCHLLCYAA
jgi:hypothetical protein